MHAGLQKPEIEALAVEGGQQSMCATKYTAGDWGGGRWAHVASGDEDVNMSSRCS